MDRGATPARGATGHRSPAQLRLRHDPRRLGGEGFLAHSQREFNLTLGEFVSGGADTTASQLLTLVLAFAKYPHVQEKARKELDAVCGTSRAPVWDDFSRLPYINAIVKEGMRWRPT
jgi:cytochrome P450